jgi:hypothetical protein
VILTTLLFAGEENTNKKAREKMKILAAHAKNEIRRCRALLMSISPR